MRKDLTVGDLRDLSDKPLVAVLASLRADGPSCSRRSTRVARVGFKVAHVRAREGDRPLAAVGYRQAGIMRTFTKATADARARLPGSRGA
jgi:hypothetical protein